MSALTMGEHISTMLNAGLGSPLQHINVHYLVVEISLNPTLIDSVQAL